MKKKPVFGVICLVIIAAIIIFGAKINPDNSENIKIEDSEVFHIRLADSSLYENGVYSEMFQIEKGVYEFRFVPNGDSPQKLSIKLLAESGVVLMNNHFELEGTLVDDGMSSWYTWDYLSRDNMLKIDEPQEVKIFVSPNGNLKGPVSIGLVSIK